MLKSAEKRLRRSPEHAKIYQNQIKDMITGGVRRKVPEEVLDNYPDPIFYLAHHEVIKVTSKCTPCIIVFNSSARFQGQSHNAYLAKGPNMLNNLLGILLRFREEQCAIMGDISKMYHSIGIPLFDEMMHCFLWRDFLSDEQPDTMP